MKKQPYDPAKDLLDGMTFWEYYKRNYLVIPIITIILIVAGGLYTWHDNEGKMTWVVYAVISRLLIALNAFVLILSAYQYNQLTKKGQSQ